MTLRILLDVNVWVNSYLAAFRGRSSSAAQRLSASVIAGHCRTGDIDLVISHLMLDTLEGVLARCGIEPDLAGAARDAVEAATAGFPLGVLGGGVHAIRDPEDLGVLETAIAGEAHLLVTNNMRDFTPGPRAAIAATIMRLDQEGQPDVLSMTMPGVSHDLVITDVFAATAWLVDGHSPPQGILSTFFP